MKIVERKIDDLIPRESNPRTHSGRQINQLANSISEFGFVNPVLIDTNDMIVAGHGRVLAAEELGLESVPTIVLSDLTEEQVRAYVIADNQLALNAGWDDNLLAMELHGLKEAGFDIALTGFKDKEAQRLLGLADSDEPYSKRVSTPLYEPVDDKPDLADLMDTTKRDRLVAAIDASELPEGEKDFLREAANRHITFHYDMIADYYANSGPEVQALMEESVLIIIDFAAAIEKGYVRMSERIAAIYLEDYPDDRSQKN